MEAVSARFAAFVEENPGLSIEQINQHLGTTSEDLTLPIRRLVAKGIIQPEGRKRATRYFIAAAEPAEPRVRSGLDVHPGASSGTNRAELGPLA